MEYPSLNHFAKAYIFYAGAGATLSPESLPQPTFVPFFSAERYPIPGDIRSTYAYLFNMSSALQPTFPANLATEIVSGGYDSIWDDGGVDTQFKKHISPAQILEPDPGQWRNRPGLIKSQSQSTLSVTPGTFNQAEACIKFVPTYVNLQVFL